MPRTSLCLVAVTLLIAGGLEASQTELAASPPIRQVDHIMIRTVNPPGLFALFTETMGLPIAWPLTRPREGVMTGGVGVGRVNLETIQFQARRNNSHDCSASASNRRLLTSRCAS